MDEAARTSGQAVGEQARAEEIREDIEQTREELGETVEALAAKTDVKAQAQAKVEDTKDAARRSRRSRSARLRGARARRPGDQGARRRGRRAARAHRSREPGRRGAGAFAAGLLAGVRSSDATSRWHRRRDRTAPGAATTAGTRSRAGERRARTAARTRERATTRARARQARQPGRARQALVAGVLKRTVARVQGGRPHRLGRRADVLRHPVAVPGAAACSSRSSGSSARSATQPLIDNLGSVAPGPAKDIATTRSQGLQSTRARPASRRSSASLVALWSASNYVGAFMRASNAIYEVEEGRPFWKVRPLQLGVTIVMVLLLALCAVAVVVTGPLAQTVGDVVGLGGTAVTRLEHRQVAGHRARLHA